MHPVAPESPEAGARLRQRATLVIGGGLLLLVLLGVGIATGALPVTAEQVTGAYSYLLFGVTIAFFGWLFLGGNWTTNERHRLYLIGVFFVAAALFWSVFEQAGSTLNLFADRNTNNVLFGRPFPSSWYQSLNALFIIIFAPMFA